MNLQMLESFDINTLKGMVTNLMSENEMIKIQLSEKNKQYDNLKKEHDKLYFDWKTYKNVFENKKNLSSFNQWFDINCEEADGDPAPTEINILYHNYVKWSIEFGIIYLNKKQFRDKLTEWQKKSKYGLYWESKKSPGQNELSNGYGIHMKFNLKLKE